MERHRGGARQLVQQALVGGGVHAQVAALDEPLQPVEQRVGAEEGLVGQRVFAVFAGRRRHVAHDVEEPAVHLAGGVVFVRGVARGRRVAEQQARAVVHHQFLAGGVVAVLVGEQRAEA